jgi:hypothetical protein
VAGHDGHNGGGCLQQREERKTRGAAALQGIEEDGGRREEGDERAREMGGRRRCVRVGKASDWRWKEAPIGGPRLSVSQRERVGERKWREVDQAGVGRLGRLG